MARDHIFGVRPEQGPRAGQENDYKSPCSPTYKFAPFASRMHLRDAGYQYDSEGGNDYALARYYSSSFGRFMSPDPLGGAIGNPQSLNRYSYVLNNPESFVDPLGLKCVTLDDGTVGDDGTLPKCNDPSVWTSETVDVNGGGGETPSELYQLLWEAEYGLQPTMPPLVYARLPFGGGPRPVGPNKPQTEVPIWVLQAEDVFSQAASNFVNEFKKGGCVADFWDRAAGVPGPAPVGPQPVDVVTAAGAGWAWWYAADNTLIVPLRSSIYRGILDTAGTVASYAAVVPADIAALTGFIGEMKDLSTGACH